MGYSRKLGHPQSSLSMQPNVNMCDLKTRIKQRMNRRDGDMVDDSIKRDTEHEHRTHKQISRTSVVLIHTRTSTKHTHLSPMIKLSKQPSY